MMRAAGMSGTGRRKRGGARVPVLHKEDDGVSQGWLPDVHSASPRGCRSHGHSAAPGVALQNPKFSDTLEYRIPVTYR